MRMDPHAAARRRYPVANVAKLSAAASVLRDEYPVVGLQVTDKYPDASVIGHARRRSSGCTSRSYRVDHFWSIRSASVGFSPVYHEDWLCVLDHLRQGEVAVSGRSGRVRTIHSPTRIVRVSRIRRLLASGLLWLVYTACRDKLRTAASPPMNGVHDYWREAMRLDFWRKLLEERAMLLRHCLAPYDTGLATPVCTWPRKTDALASSSPDEFVSFIELAG